MATIPTEGLERIAVVIDADCTHMAVGTGTTAETPGDSQLDTETDRKALTKQITQGRKLQERALFTNAQLPATVEELGLFMNGTASANSGSIVTRALSNFVKGSQDLLVVVEIEVKEE